MRNNKKKKRVNFKLASIIPRAFYLPRHKSIKTAFKKEDFSFNKRSFKTEIVTKQKNSLFNKTQ